MDLSVCLKGKENIIPVKIKYIKHILTGKLQYTQRGFPQLPPRPQDGSGPSRLGLQNTLTASLQRGKTPANECLAYDTKQSGGEASVMLKLWGMRSTPLLPLHQGPLWPRMVAPDRALSMGQIELNCVLMLNWIAWNRTALTFKLHTYAKLNCLK